MSGGKTLDFLYTILGQILGTIYGFVGHYALSIAVFTIFVKVLLYPLNVSQIKSSKEMTAVQPKLKAIQEKYKDNKEQLNIKTMELYKEHNINPIAGCLPLLIQMPIIIALFGTLREPLKYVFNGNKAIADVASSQGFLWISDLSAPDNIGLLWSNAPGFIASLPGALAIITAILTYFQMTSMYKGQQQNEQMKMMNNIFPIMILVMSNGLSAGLMVYWVVSTSFQIVQQYVINKTYKGASE